MEGVSSPGGQTPQPVCRGLHVTEQDGADLDRWNRRRTQAQQALAGETECRRRRTSVSRV